MQILKYRASKQMLMNKEKKAEEKETVNTSIDTYNHFAFPLLNIFGVCNTDIGYDGVW